MWHKHDVVSPGHKKDEALCVWKWLIVIMGSFAGQLWNAIEMMMMIDIYTFIDC